MKNLLNIALISITLLSLIAFIVTSITLDEKCGPTSIPSLPHIFQGYAKYGNKILTNKTVTATLDGVDFSTMTDPNGFYSVGPARCSNSKATAITFTVCTRNASETTNFSEGSFTRLNLTIPNNCPNPGTPYCLNHSASYLCDPTFRCSDGIGDNGYDIIGKYSCQGYCDGFGNCDYADNCSYSLECDPDDDNDNDPDITDCDPNNSTFYHGANEICNGIDDNCDNVIDEENALGCTIYYNDGDNDLYGLTNDSKCLCSAQNPYDTQLSNDCDDLNASINPVTTEICNGIDDNCDSIIDEEGALGCSVYNKDFDNDGYGSNETKCLCSAQDPYDTKQNNDCNDNNTLINPSATESCNGIDDDCDGLDKLCCIITSPISTDYSTEKIQLNVTLLNKTKSLKYIDYNGSRLRERTLCVECNEYGSTRTRTITFEDGYHNISIFTDDGLCNKTISFFVDSTKPKVTRQEPRNKKYCNGNFNVTYTEEYPKNVYIYYENNILVKNDCQSGRNKKCGFYTLLSEYENQSINFHFEVEDVFWKIPYRINYTCLVDTIPPHITDLHWRVDGRSLYLNISLDDEAESLRYIYYSDSRATERTLCLKCNEYGDSRIRRVPFRKGDYTLTIIAEDEAENKDERNFNFTVNY